MPKRNPPPPYTLTSDIVSLVADIAEQVGRLNAQPDAGMDLRLRRRNRILQVHATLALAGSPLTVEQVEAVGREMEAEHAAQRKAGHIKAASPRLGRGD